MKEDHLNLFFLNLKFSLGCNALEILDNNHNNVVKLKEDPDNDPSVHVFFKVTDLYQGKRMPLYFESDNDSAPMHLLSRPQADSIPFSLSKLPSLLEFFQFSNTSIKAQAMETTLRQCESKPKGDEFKRCVTSLEAMLDMTQEFFGSVKPKVLTTKILSSNHTLYQNYTLVEKPLEVNRSEMVACHSVAYPYLVYYCHGHKGHMTRIFKLALRGDNNERIESISVCHKDTSMWDADHVVFRLLGGYPGSGPACHVIPIDNLVWVA
ncbi:putative BURP domain-containing protein [Helianthus annuus]|uniref:BURP domain-containing protein BNM2C n=1 Tax=Helianthus annuus TaxID=4232 RepID=UPI00165322DA|nr:BURP domain-containing protein BNM2C [Helianthus annuus]KAJ0592973.1 putative BURP domain-containing protein [Helianthus annuus]KAJ0607988.1 putative BURP domain-containing protein [Helianthus annuus]KAJ0768052.1 putative BURP domain-containing protein [Helianthus annuus]KAJ0935679.1 putative BURP domain-containing protein [Helianthus annuus]